MPGPNEQSFRLKRSFVRLSHFGTWFFAAMAVVSVGLAIFETTQSSEKTGSQVLYLLMALFFAGFAYAGFRMIRQFERAPVSVDEDGIWSITRGKPDGLVRWEDVVSIKERPSGQRLELLGKDGASLIKLEYQLVGFEELRQIVLSKIRQRDLNLECPATFNKSVGYHVLTIGLIIGFSILAYYVGQTHPILGLLVFAVVVLMSTQDYLKTVTMLTINQRTLDIRYPLRRKTLDLSEVSSVHLSDQFVKGNRLPEVIVESHTGDKPVRLKQLGADATVLYDLLDRWKDESLFVQGSGTQTADSGQ